MIVSCSYCGTQQPEFTLDPVEPFVVKCVKCKRELLLVSNKGKHLPILPDTLKDKTRNYVQEDEGEIF